MIIRCLARILLMACIIYNPTYLLAAQSEEDKIGEQLIAEGINLGYASACMVGGTGDYEWMDKKVGTCIRKKYHELDDIMFQSIFLGSVEHGVEMAKKSSNNCERMFNWLLEIYKECGVNPNIVYKGRKGFLEKRKRVLGY